MREKIGVVIADDNAEFASLLGSQVNKEADFDIFGIAHDGLETIELIEQKKPDVVVLDLIMPNLDGIGVLEKIKDSGMKDKPIFIILSAMCQDTFVKRALSMGAQYYVIKPFNISVLISRIRQICTETENDTKDFLGNSQKFAGSEADNIESEVTDLLHEEGIQAHLAGFRFVRDAIVLCVKDKNLLKSITRNLYPQIATKNNSSAKKVERAIRSAIDNGWKKTGRDMAKKKTNCEFISYMIEKVNNK